MQHTFWIIRTPFSYDKLLGMTCSVWFSIQLQTKALCCWWYKSTNRDVCHHAFSLESQKENLLGLDPNYKIMKNSSAQRAPIFKSRSAFIRLSFQTTNRNFQENFIVWRFQLSGLSFFLTLPNMNSSVLKPSTLLLFFYSFLCFCSPTKADYIYSVCSNHSEIASNSYKTNLNSLFSSLTTKGPLTGFYNTTSGKTPDEVFGLVLCRGDDTSNDCQICIKEASQELLQRCNSSKESTIWYDECLLRYSSQNFFSSVTLKKELSLLNTISASDPIRFNTILGQLMDNISSEAAFSSSQMFATGEAVVSSLQKIYGLVQCTRDLSKEDCNDCLESSIEKLSSCCSGKQGGQVISKSCFLRYEVYPFFRGASTGATSPPPENAMVDGKNSTTTAPTATTKGQCGDG